MRLNFKCNIAIIACLLCVSIPSHALNRQEKKWFKAVSNTYGIRAGLRVKTWRKQMSRFKYLSINAQLKGINDFFNQLYFVEDIRMWGKNDYWATPLEFLGSNGGDCEDFTIAKYFSLRELGISDKKLRLIYVKAIKLNQFHMVLAYYPTPRATPLILDNINPKIKLASERKDLLPIYSFNGANLWLMKSSAIQGRLAGKSSSLNLWHSLLLRQRKLQLNKPIINYDE